jgi:hypothetical protein
MLPPRLAETHRLVSRGAVRLLVRRDWEAALPVDAMLAGAPLAEWGAPVAHALSGRGPVEVLSTPRGEIVGKALRRGGLAGGLLRDTFFDARRPLREAEAAEQLAARGIRTPPVVAARVTRRAAGLRVESATARVPGVDLLEAARDRRALPALAIAAGRTLRAAHDAGLRHRDLQVKNLLVPAGFPGAGGAGRPEPLVILDLDRCSVGEALDDAERRHALVRFGRSLVKQGVLPRTTVAAAVPSAAIRACRPFVRAYCASQGGEAAFLVSLATGVQDQVARHGWRWSDPAGRTE